MIGRDGKVEETTQKREIMKEERKLWWRKCEEVNNGLH